MGGPLSYSPENFVLSRGAARRWHTAGHPSAHDGGRCQIGRDVRHRLEDVRQQIYREEEAGAFCCARFIPSYYNRTAKFLRPESAPRTNADG